jgi:hypothetical protein
MWQQLYWLDSDNDWWPKEAALCFYIVSHEFAQWVSAQLWGNMGSRKTQD